MSTSREPFLRLVSVDQDDDLDAVRRLLLEYGSLRRFDEALGDYEAELAELPGEYEPPDGHLLLARWKDRAVGCAGLRTIAPGICEMKRMYVGERFRGHGIGRRLAEELIDVARHRRFSILRLDTHPWMEAAQGLYASLGFREIDAYRFNPIEGIRFFELELG